MAYIDMVEDILICILRASCEGNWNLHLHAVRNMIPWCFAYDKLNYARYMSPYYAQMTNLPEKNPLAYCDEIGVSLFQKCGTRTRTKLVDIVNVAVTVGMYEVLSLGCMHIQDVTLSVRLQAKGRQARWNSWPLTEKSRTHSYSWVKCGISPEN